MNSTFQTLLMFLFIFVIFFPIGYFVNRIKGSRMLFGIRIPAEYENNPKLLEIEKHYKFNYLVCSVFAMIIAILLSGLMSDSLAITLAVFLELFALLIPYIVANKKVKKLKNSVNWAKLSSKKVFIDIPSKSEVNYFSRYLYIIPFALSILGLILVLININHLPARVPIHFGVNGADTFVDGTSSSAKIKIIEFAVLSPLMVAFMYALDMKKLRASRKLNGGKVVDLKARAAAYNKTTAFFIFITSSIVSILCFYTVLVMIGLLDASNVFMMSITILLFIVIGVFIYIFVRLGSRKNSPIKNDDSVSLNKDNINNTSEDIYIDDDNKYKFGMFYYDKNDPKLFVEKRMGIGYTINHAKWQAWLFYVILIAFILTSIFL